MLKPGADYLLKLIVSAMVHTNIHTHIHIHIHTYIHTYINFIQVSIIFSCEANWGHHNKGYSLLQKLNSVIENQSNHSWQSQQNQSNEPIK